MPRVARAKTAQKDTTAQLRFEAGIKDPDTALKGILKNPGV